MRRYTSFDLSEACFLNIMYGILVKAVGGDMLLEYAVSCCSLAHNCGTTRERSMSSLLGNETMIIIFFRGVAVQYAN